jgi:hypothetical protein
MPAETSSPDDGRFAMSGRPADDQSELGQSQILPGTYPAGRSRQWLGAVPAAIAWAACRSLPRAWPVWSYLSSMPRVVRREVAHGRRVALPVVGRDHHPHRDDRTLEWAPDGRPESNLNGQSELHRQGFEASFTGARRFRRIVSGLPAEYRWPDEG